MALARDVEGVFAEAECEALIALALSAGLQPATVYGGEADQVDEAVRAAETGYHPRSEKTAWAYERLDALLSEAGRAFGIAAAPIAEPFQIVRYREGGHFRNWHSDAGFDARATRRLSASVELSPLDSHEGGWLEVVPDTVGRVRSLGRGGARVFPSQALHRVTPVVRGERWALVVWTGGH